MQWALIREFNKCKLNTCMELILHMCITNYNTCFFIARNVIITDIDECDDENGDCDQTCVNEEGTYHCECLSGYILDEDKMRCSGELMGGNNCTGVCY